MAKSLHRWYCKNRHTNSRRERYIWWYNNSYKWYSNDNNGAISVANITTLNTTGLASLDGGIDVDGAFTVADSSAIW